MERMESKPCNPCGGLHLLRVKQVQRPMWADIRKVTVTSIGTSGMSDGTAGGTELVTPGTGGRHCSNATSSTRLMGKVLNNELRSLVSAQGGWRAAGNLFVFKIWEFKAVSCVFWHH